MKEKWTEIIGIGILDRKKMKKELEHKDPMKIIENIRAEIMEWLAEPPCFIPNYEAYGRFLGTIDKYMEGDNANDTIN